MADIAILVAEEYERRVKRNNPRRTLNPSTPARSGEGGGVSLVASVSFPSSEMTKERAITAAAEKIMSNWVVVEEPKSEMGLAACHGFFSA